MRSTRDEVAERLEAVRHLMPLLMKHRNGGCWSTDEKRELKRQLRSLAHLSPILLLLALPGTFILLPLIAWWLDRRNQRRGGGSS